VLDAVKSLENVGYLCVGALKHSVLVVKHFVDVVRMIECCWKRQEHSLRTLLLLQRTLQPQLDNILNNHIYLTTTCIVPFVLLLLNHLFNIVIVTLISVTI